MANKKIKGITIKFGADTMALDKALKDVDKTSKSLGGELKSVNRLLKFDPKNTQLLAQKQELLNEQIGNTNKKLDALKQAQSEVEKKFKSGNLGVDEYREFQRTIANTEQDLKSYTSQLEKLNDVSGKVAGKIQNAGESVQKIGGKVSDAGKALAPLSGAFAGAGLASSKMSMDFEEAIAKVSTIADETEVPISELEKGIINLSNQTGISAAEIADNVYNAISAGQKTVDALAFVEKSTKLAKAGFADAGSALDVLTTIMNAYGLEASEVGKVSDMLIQTQNKGKTTVGELASTMGKIIPTAKANNVALDQITTGYVKLTSNGVAAAESTTYMNSMLNELGKSGTKVSDLLKKKTGQSFAELMQSGMSLADALEIVSNGAKEQGLAFGDMWGSAEAAKAGLVLLGDGAQGFNSTLDEMRNSTGATEEALGKLETKSDAFRKTFNELKNVMIALGDALLEVLAPVIEVVVDKVKEFSKWFSELNDESKKIIAVGTIVVAALAPVLLIVGKIIGSIGSLISILGSIAGVIGAPALAIIGAVAAVAGAFAIAYAKIEPFREFVNGLIDDIRKFAENVYNTYIGPALEEVKGAFEDALSAITGFWDEYGEQIWEAVQNLFTILSPIIFGALEGIAGFVDSTLGNLMNTIQIFWEFIKGFFESNFEILKGIIKAFSGFFTGDMETMTSGIKDIFDGFFKSIENGFTFLKDTLGGIIKGIANTICGTLGGAINGVIKGINWILNAVGSDKSFDEWNVPKFAKGTGGLPRDTIGVVNDQKGSTYKEMIIPPDGKPFIPEGRDVVLPMKKGTKIMPANQTKSFLDGLPHFASGIGDFFSGIWDTVKEFSGSVWDYLKNPGDIVKIAIDKFADLTNAFEPWITVAKGAINTVFDSVVDFITGIFDEKSHVNYTPGAGVEQWRKLAEQALRMTNQYSDANLNLLLYQMQTESGGNPNAINDWDINAINGTPSKGLMQVIDPTFRAYAMPGYDTNIWDPLSNMLAAIRYTVSRYGSLASGWNGHGYAAGIGNIHLSDIFPELPTLDVSWFKDGGILTKPAFFQMPSGKVGGAGEAGPEAIAPIRKLKEYIKEAVLEVAGEKDININVSLTVPLDGKVLAEGTVNFMRPLLERQERFNNLLEGVR